MLHSGHYTSASCASQWWHYYDLFPQTQRRDHVRFNTLFFSCGTFGTNQNSQCFSWAPHLQAGTKSAWGENFSVQSEAVLRCSVHLYKCCCSQKCIFKWKIILRVTRAINIMEHFYFSNSYLGQFLRVELGGKNYYFHFQQLCRDARIRNVWRKHRKWI